MTLNDTMQLMFHNIQVETANEFWVACVEMELIQSPDKDQG